MLSDVRYKILSHISGLEDFKDYVVDMNGNVWSYKNRKVRKLKPHSIHDGYLKVALWNKKGKRKHFYIHRLVAICFIPCKDSSMPVLHKNKNIRDNRVENLEWKNNDDNVSIVRIEDTSHYQVNEELTNKIEKVFYASQRKGLPSKNNDQFFTELVNNALDDYVRQYGLHKIMRDQS